MFEIGRNSEVGKPEVECPSMFNIRVTLLHIVGSYKYIPTLCYNDIYAIEQRNHSQFD
jgi:hypothetical protein